MVHRNRRPVIAALLVAAATLVPSVAAQAQVVDDTTTTTSTTTTSSTTTTTEPPATTPPPTVPPETTPPPTSPPATAPPETTPPPTSPPATAPPETTPPPATPPAPVDEYLGPLPLGGCAISTTVQLNTRSRDVVCVERVLAGLGYAFEGPDEFFSVHSANSLKAWQRGQGIRADGIVGPATGRRLGIWITATPTAGAPAPGGPGTYLGPLPLGGCAITSVVRLNTTSPDVICVEQVLAGLGYSFEGPDQFFSVHSANSLKAWQRGQGIRADGIVGPATGARLGIWGVATPPTAAAPTAPQAGDQGLPANSGSGRRVVYSRSQQRVWAVEADGTVVKTHAVSGRTREPYAGTYSVYSRSLYTFSTANPAIKWRYMVRFAYGPGGGRIGFHEIPNKRGVALQTEGQLGQPLSSGCVRQSTADAQWMWNWAGVGTKVVVL